MRPATVLAAGGRAVSSLLSSTEWMLPSPATQVHTVSVLPSHLPSLRHEFAFSNLATSLSNGAGGKGNGEVRYPRFHVVRDDLLHPLANGNKARKLDALLPLLHRGSATDIVRIHPRVFSSLGYLVSRFVDNVHCSGYR
jgi:D-cysteine desulfhydrase